MGADTQDRIPREAAVPTTCAWCKHPIKGDVMAHLKECTPTSYAAIRRGVCQELAEALREHFFTEGATFQEGVCRAAEFVESYGKADTDG